MMTIGFGGTLSHRFTSMLTTDHTRSAEFVASV